MADSFVWPFLLYLAAVVGLVVTMLALSSVLGQKRLDPATLAPFESGIVPASDANLPVSVEFYLVAIFFVLFDLETVFIFAWAIAFYELGWAGYAAMSVFVAVLLVALIYAWRLGVLEWGRKTRVGLNREERV